MHPIYGMLSPIARIHEHRNQGVEKEMVLLMITPSDTLENFLIPVPTTFSSSGLEVLILDQGAGSLDFSMTTLVFYHL